MDIQTAIAKIIDRQDLQENEMRSVMHAIMTGATTPAQIGGFLIGLRMKGETVTEISAAASVMWELASKVDVSYPHLVDIVGTGGDGSNTFNISTAAAFVIAAAGGKVAKHGNRSASSKSGSADLLEAAGVKIDLTPEQVAECIGKIGIGFMFAPQHHGAMKHAIGPRKELGTRTIFNMLGPLTNPAGVTHQMIGVYAQELVQPVAEVLQKLGSEHVLVVHSEDGLDEISIAAPTNVAELKEGKISSYQITPEEFGIERNGLNGLKAGSVEESLKIVTAILNNEPGAARDIVILNAGAAIYVADLTIDLNSGIEKANEVISNGLAKKKLEQFIDLTNTMTPATQADIK